MPRVPHWMRAICAIAIFCIFGTVSTGAQGLTGTISGNVKDQTGGVLPGVSVTLASPSLIGGRQTRVTDGNGSFRFPVLPPGAYTLTFELAGFGSIERTGLIIEPDRTVTVDQTMRPASVAQEVVVMGEVPLVDVKSTSVASTVDSTTIEQVPVQRRFTDLLNLMPGVQNGLYTFSPANSVYGSRVTNNSYTVDGVNFNDPQVQSAVTDIPFDDLQEVQVSTSGQSAEFGSASGGVFNFITKSGSNVLRGLASAYGQNKDLASNNISSELAAQGIGPSVLDKDYEAGGNLGGPIVRDRLWFFGSYHRQEQERSQSDFPEPIGVSQWQSTVKLDGQVNASNRVGVFYNFRDRYSLPWNPSFQTAGDPRTWGAIGWKNHLLGINWTATPQSSTVIQVRGGIALFDLINSSPNAVAGTPIYTETSSGVVTGGTTATQGLMQRDRYEAKVDLSRFVDFARGGSHELKTGFQFEHLPMNSERVDVPQANYVRHQLLNGQPYRVQLLAGPGNALTTIDHWAVYLQDQWSVNARLTLNAGIRYDRWNGSLGPDVFEAGPWDAGERVEKQGDLIPLSHVAPRVGVAWDVMGNRRWAVKANYGRFYQRIAGTDISGLRRTTGGNLTFDWIDRNGDRVYQAGEEGTLRSDGRRNPATFGQIDPNVEMAYTDAFNAGVEVQLATVFSLQVNGVWKRDRNYRSNVDVTKPFDVAFNQVSVINPLNNQPMTVFSVKPAFQPIPSQSLLTNPSEPVELYHNYDGVEFVLRRRLQNNWMFQSSYNWGHSYGTIGTLFFDAQGNPYTNPNNLIFVDGDQKLDRRHMVKFSGLYRLPYGIQASGRFEYMSGLPIHTSGSGGAGVTGAYYVRFNRSDYPGIETSAFLTVPGEPQGTRRFDAETRVDFRLQKQTALGPNRSVDVMLDVFNAFNANTIGRVETLNTTLPNFLRPAEIMLPRAIRVGARISF